MMLQLHSISAEMMMGRIYCLIRQSPVMFNYMINIKKVTTSLVKYKPFKSVSSII